MRRYGREVIERLRQHDCTEAHFSLPGLKKARKCPCTFVRSLLCKVLRALTRRWDLNYEAPEKPVIFLSICQNWHIKSLKNVKTCVITRVCQLQKVKSQTFRTNILQKFDYFCSREKKRNKIGNKVFENYVPVICTELRNQTMISETLSSAF